jgi:hypothetical protein
MFWLDQVLSALNGKYDVEINLRVGVGHTQKMPLLTELGNLFSGVTTNMPALRACGFFGRRKSLRGENEYGPAEYSEW